MKKVTISIDSEIATLDTLLKSMDLPLPGMHHRLTMIRHMRLCTQKFLGKL